MKTILILSLAISAFLSMIGIFFLADISEWLLLLIIPMAIFLTFSVFAIMRYGDKWNYVSGNFRN